MKVKSKKNLSKDVSAECPHISTVSNSSEQSDTTIPLHKMNTKSGISSELVSVMKSMSQVQSKKKDKEKSGTEDSENVYEADDVTYMYLKNIKTNNSDKNKRKAKFANKKSNKSPEDQEARTIFVGNVDVKQGKRKLINLFSKYGTVEAIRLRSAAPAEPQVSKKEAVIKNNIHPSRSTVNAYVRFETKDMMEAALEANGTVLLGNHLRVDRAAQKSNDHDRQCAVFVGNLPFECEEESLYKHFEECGKIDNVRIVRDKTFTAGKGFGYVNFKSSDAVEVALQLDGKLFMKRNLRIQRCVKKVKKTKKKDKFTPQEGQQIGFMKLKGQSGMSLKFMKNQKKNLGKGNFPHKNNRKNQSKNEELGRFSGKEMLESQQFKKMKRNRQRPTKDDRKRMFVARHLTGAKPVKKKI